MRGIMGTKIGMTQVFEKNGRLLPVTILHVEPNQILELKTVESHGYVSTKLGYFSTQETKLNKPLLGLFKKCGSAPKRYIREIRDMSFGKVGDELRIGDVFKEGEFIDVQSLSKGHGYTGAIKRWNFKIGPLSHGAGYKHRFQGSVETGRGGSQAQRVFKGKKMAGSWGNESVTIQNLAIVSIDVNENIIAVHGAVPGPKGCLVVMRSSKKKSKQLCTFDLVTKDNAKNDLTTKETEG